MSGPGGERLATAIDGSVEGLSLFRRAAQIAASLNIALEATILDDRNLQHLADLPFGRIFGFSTGVSRNFDRSVLADLDRAKAERIRKAHKELIDTFQISCTTSRENAASVAHTVLQLSRQNRYVLARGFQLAVTYQQRPSRSPRFDRILVVLNGDESDLDDAVRSGRAVAAGLESVPVFLAPQYLGDRLQHRLEQTGHGAKHEKSIMELVESIELGDLCAIAARHNAGLVVLSLDLSDTSEADVRNMLDQIGCPVLLVNQAHV